MGLGVGLSRVGRGKTNFGARPAGLRKETRKYYGIPGTNIGPPELWQPEVRADRAFVNLKPGKTTAELEAEGNVGQGRMAYEDRVGQRKQNVALRRRAKYLGIFRRMGRRPRKYTSPAYRAVQRHFDAIDRGGGETLPFGSIPIGAFSPPITV
jgi:hypothetical protein